jgi:hypothetical protein
LRISFELGMGSAGGTFPGPAVPYIRTSAGREKGGGDASLMTAPAARLYRGRIEAR